MSSHHDGVGEVAVSLALQPHGAELSSHVALRGGFVQGGLPDASHFRGHKEGQHALESRNDDTTVSAMWMRRHQTTVCRVYRKLSSPNVSGSLG